MKLITVSNLKSFLEINAGTTHDVLLGMLIDYVSKRIETFLNRELEKTERTTYFNTGRKYLYLNAYPIDISVESAPEVYLDDSLQELNSDYFIWENTGLIEMFYEYPITEPKQIKVIWTGGYNEIDDSTLDEGSLDVPDDLKFACMLQCAYVFKRRNDLGLSTVNLPNGGFTVNRPTDLLPEVKSILKSYRNNVIR